MALSPSFKDGVRYPFNVKCFHILEASILQLGEIIMRQQQPDCNHD